MVNTIEVNRLTKRYHQFLLDGISFTVPEGYICGFIGQNGAGKTTTLKLMLNMAVKNSGEITLFGKPHDDVTVKDDLGVLFDQPYFQEDWTAIDIEKALRSFYSHWNSVTYYDYLKRFSLDPKQKYKTMSRGMKMKLGMAVALCHEAKLLLLDEPTGGLDPVMRDEVLDMLRDYMTVESRSIFFSTHITSDLEKIADYIIYIHKGRIFFSGLKDELLEKYCIIKGGKEDLPQEKRRHVIGLREHVGGFEGMMELSNVGGMPTNIITEPATLDDIMIYINREDSAL